MSEPDFEFPPEGHSFDPGDELYLIDDNKVDLLPCVLKKKSSKRHQITLSDGTDLSFKTSHRLLLRTSTNNSIYETQRKTPPPPPPPPDPEIPPPKRRPKVKSAVLPADFIANEAWKAGIQDPETLRTFLSERTEEAVKVYQNRVQLLGMADNPLFNLGGNIDSEDIKNFWRRAKSQWSEMFGDEISVPRDAFLKKVSEAFRLPNQTIGNARSSLKFFFETSEIGIPAFCAFLAQFGPKMTLMRKVGGYWKCSREARDLIQGVNVSAIENLSELAEIEGNSFEISTVNGTKIVYNLVGIESDGDYLVDDDGKRYASWVEFCEANPPELEAEEEE